MKKIGIYINSSSRHDSVLTIRQMPKEWKNFCFISVPNEQYKNYEKHNKWPVLKIPKNVPQFLSSQRQWIAQNSEFDYVFFMDDDLTFQKRKNGSLSLEVCEKEDMNEMLRDVQSALKGGFPLVGISARLGNNRCQGDHEDITRVSRCYAFSKSVFNQLKINLAPFEPFLMQDFHLALTFLKSGFQNRVLYNWAQGDRGSNTAGGCSAYRTPELMKKVAAFLAAEHKGFVTVCEKKTKGGWSGFPKDKNGNTIRTDVTVAWKKAYEYERRKRNGCGISKFL